MHRFREPNADRILLRAGCPITTGTTPRRELSTAIATTGRVCRGRWWILIAATLLVWSASALTACGADDVDCEDSGVRDGAPCSSQGAVCQYADDCGGETLECQGSVWVASNEFGCFADPIPCEEGPVEGDGCDHDPRCDPDGDCRNVLECPSFTWVAYEVCSEEYCPAAAPQQGKACDIEDRACDVDHPCGGRLFACQDGWWHFIGGAICTDPVACADVPVENDACATKDEVCEPLVEDLPALTCDGSTWQSE